MVYGYIRVSTREQADSGLGLEAQKASVLSRYPKCTIVEDLGESGKSLDRAGLNRLLRIIQRGDVLVVSKLDRLSRKIKDFVYLMDRAVKEGWSIVAFDLGLDMSTPVGEMAAHMVAAFAQYELRLISQRTKDAMAEAKARGVRIGRPPVLPDALRSRIKGLWNEGYGFEAIARHLTLERVPTARGGSKWWASSVREICMGAAR